MKTIVVKGIGKASVKPDLVVITMVLESRDMKYDRAMELAANRIEELEKRIEAAGFERDSLKTTNFNVRTEYESYQDDKGRYQSRFAGYAVSHDLKLEFEFDSERISIALCAIADSKTNPEINVNFTVKDSSAVNEQMLRSATINALQKAKILAEASGVRLGELQNISYNWDEINLYSNTRYAVENDCIQAPMMAKCVSIEPEDISVSDTVAFTWEII